MALVTRSQSKNPWANELFRIKKLLIEKGLLSRDHYGIMIRPYKSTFSIPEDKARSLCWKLCAEFGLQDRYVAECKSHQVKEEFTVDKRFTIITANVGNIHTGQNAPRNFYATFSEAEEAAKELVRSGKMSHGVLVVEVQAKVELDVPPVKTTLFTRVYSKWNSRMCYHVGDLVQYDGGSYRCKLNHDGVCPGNSVHGPGYWEKV